MNTPKNILVIRNDKLGDFMLAYPTFNVIKKLFPTATIYALVPQYTQPMAELCPWIDATIVDDTTKGIASLANTASRLKTFRFDAALCLHSSTRIALSLFLARIPHRFAPASRLDQVFYNHRLTQRRSRSEKPEFEYNIDLANFMGECYALPAVSQDQPPHLVFDSEEQSDYRQAVFKDYRLDDSRKIVIVHPGSGGSANNLSLDQYAQLVFELSSNKELYFVITAGPDEADIANTLSSMLTRGGIPHDIYHSTQGIVNFSHFIALSYLFISGSTGPLHIAGALDVRTAGFYTERTSATALRWRTLNSNNRRLHFSSNNISNREDMSSVDITAAANKILKTFFTAI